MGEGRTRRSRDPEATREAILEAARTLLAKDGPEGLSLSEVAHLAGVNRGTAYQHFATRENLIQATAEWVSDKLFRAVFGDPETIGERRVEEADSAELTDRLAEFASDNPELCRVWLLQLLASPDPTSDPFWREYSTSLARWANTDLAQDNIDVEALSVMTLSGTFLWPVWARAHARNDGERRKLARRYAQEVLRLSLYGTMKPDKHPEIVRRLDRAQQHRIKLRAVGGD
jgi:AcrR family transcriptional regulator